MRKLNEITTRSANARNDNNILCTGNRHTSKTNSSPMGRLGGGSILPDNSYTSIHPYLYTSKKKAAFTLAEVLITLGIIGVVAAMTIPTLIQNYNKKVAAVRAKKAYNELSQAIELSKIDNGEMSTWDYPQDYAIQSTKDFVDKYIKPYYKDLRPCSEGLDDKCGSTVAALGANYILSNGTSIAIRATFPNRHYFIVVIDTNNATKPNVLGKDAFSFDTKTGKLMPQGWFNGLKKEDILNGYSFEGYTFECKKSKTDLNNSYELNRHGCTALLMLDGWEMKKDYPY